MSAFTDSSPARLLTSGSFADDLERVEKQLRDLDAISGTGADAIVDPLRVPVKLMHSWRGLRDYGVAVGLLAGSGALQGLAGAD